VENGEFLGGERGGEKGGESEGKGAAGACE
jgi:hypothetical protein